MLYNNASILKISSLTGEGIEFERTYLAEEENHGIITLLHKYIPIETSSALTFQSGIKNRMCLKNSHSNNRVKSPSDLYVFRFLSSLSERDVARARSRLINGPISGRINSTI